MAKNIRWSSGTTSSKESATNAAQIKREISESRNASSGKMVSKDIGSKGSSKSS